MRLSLIALTTSLAVATIAAQVINCSEDSEDSDINLDLGIDAKKRNDDVDNLSIGLAADVDAKKRDEDAEDLLISVGL